VYGKPFLLALTVPYHDTNDFYFSGHIAMSTVYLIYFYVIDSKFGWYFTVWQWLFNYWTMTVLRTHYIIDYPPGIAAAFLVYKVAEIISFIFEVGIMGTR
jgi:hypothetical protein